MRDHLEMIAVCQGLFVRVQHRVYCDVCTAGVPSLVLIDEENRIISRNARFVVANDIEGKV